MSLILIAREWGEELESEGITESVREWRTDVPAEVINALRPEKVMFEATEPEVNLFVDHSQIVQLEPLRRGIWGTKGLWDCLLTSKG